jgi:hypothetical protein
VTNSQNDLFSEDEGKTLEKDNTGSGESIGLANPILVL